MAAIKGVNDRVTVFRRMPDIQLEGHLKHYDSLLEKNKQLRESEFRYNKRQEHEIKRLHKVLEKIAHPQQGEIDNLVDAVELARESIPHISTEQVEDNHAEIQG